MVGFIEDDDEKPDPNQQMRLFIVHEGLETQSHHLHTQNPCIQTQTHPYTHSAHILQSRGCVKWCVCSVSMYRIYLFIISKDIVDICALSATDLADWTRGASGSACIVLWFGAGRSPAYMQRMDFFVPLYVWDGLRFFGVCASA